MQVGSIATLIVSPKNKPCIIPKAKFKKNGCRKMSSEDKRKLGIALAKLSTEDISKALEIVAQNNPSFQATAEEVDLDIDAQVNIYIPHHVPFDFLKQGRSSSVVFA